MAEAKRRTYSNEFKLGVLLRLEAGEDLFSLAEAHGISPRLIYNWRRVYAAYGAAGLARKRGRPSGWRPPARPASLEPAGAPFGSSEAGRVDTLAAANKRIGELERVIGRQQADLHFFREALRLWDATSLNGGAPASTRRSKT